MTPTTPFPAEVRPLSWLIAEKLLSKDVTLSPLGTPAVAEVWVEVELPQAAQQRQPDLGFSGKDRAHPLQAGHVLVFELRFGVHFEPHLVSVVGTHDVAQRIEDGTTRSRHRSSELLRRQPGAEIDQ